MSIDVQVVCAAAPVPLLMADWGIYPLTPCCHASTRKRVGDVVCCGCGNEVDGLFGISWMPDDEHGWAVYKQLLMSMDGTHSLASAALIVKTARHVVDTVMTVSIA